jgi:hypothetical protein
VRISPLLSRPRCECPALLVDAVTLALPFASPVAAQDRSPGFREEFLRRFGSSMWKFVRLAEAMPEERYGVVAPWSR